MAFHGLKDHFAEIILRTPFGDETRRVDLNNSWRVFTVTRAATGNIFDWIRV